MEYIRQRGSYEDLPLDEIFASFLEIYPGWERDASGNVRRAGDLGGVRDEAFHS